MGNDEAFLSLRGVSKGFPDAPGSPEILKGIDLEVARGDAIAIVGPSGSGKSTLLNIIGALDVPTAGTVEFEGNDLSKMSDRDLAKLRNDSIGFVFQLHHLLPQCSAIENVLTPALVHPNAGDARVRAEDLLKRVGLGDRMHYMPAQLSGGERQRVAVVRALINEPKLLLADEPTGSLNTEGAQDLAKLLRDLNEESEMAIVLVTHAPAIAKTMDRMYELRGGALSETTSPSGV